MRAKVKKKQDQKNSENGEFDGQQSTLARKVREGKFLQSTPII